MMIYRLDRFGRGGHHRPFNERGIPGVRIMETHEHYHRQHQDLRTEDGIEYGDVIEGVDFDYARKLTALNVVSLAGMASAPPFPANVAIEGAVQPSTTLAPDHGAAVDLQPLRRTRRQLHAGKYRHRQLSVRRCQRVKGWLRITRGISGSDRLFRRVID
jgi:hypothetical protein